MPERKTKELKELIYSTLSGDAALESLLGGAGRVRQANPQNLSEYPLVVYSFLSEIDDPFVIDQPSNVALTPILIECFSSESNSAQVDDLTDRVYELLHGQRLSNNTIQMYSIYRVNSKPIFEPDIKVQKTESIYNAYNATI